MDLFLFGGKPTPRGRAVDLRSRLLLLLCFGRCTLRIFATEGTGKLASVIRVDLRVVLSRAKQIRMQNGR